MAVQDGVAVRRGLEEDQSKSAGRRIPPRQEYEVWYIRDEWALDHEVLHPPLAGLRIEQSILIAMEKSAEGILVWEVTHMRDWKRVVRMRRTYPTKARTVRESR
jgi:hypothetical protein